MTGPAMRLLILNPNTSAAVTTRLLGHAQAHLASRALARPVTLLATTAQLGASYIMTSHWFSHQRNPPRCSFQPCQCCARTAASSAR